MTTPREARHDVSSPSSVPETGYLPESDGKPMAETDVHRSQMVELLDCLEEYYRADPRVYVTGNIFLYFRNPEGERQAISPRYLCRPRGRKEAPAYLQPGCREKGPGCRD